jgi:hypothetical protein
MPAVIETIRRGPAAAAWLVAAILIAFGSAGLVSAAIRLPGTAARADLTWVNDRAARAALDGARVEIQAVAADVEQLGTTARGAVSALTAHDLDVLQGAIDDGTTIAAGIEADAARIGSRLKDLDAFGPGAATRLSPSLVSEHALMLDALAATDGLGVTWSGLAGAAAAAADLTTILLDHDTIVADAAAQGRADNWSEALTTLDGADDLMAKATSMRDVVARTADVTILDEWLSRNRRYDTALRTLYEALLASGGRSNDAVRAAFAEEGTARAQLPPDTRGLVLIIAELGRAGLNDAVIEIERVRGGLFEALSAAETATPTDAP